MEQTRRSRKRDTTHRAIIHSAKMLFEQDGLGNVTIERIAEGADVSRSTFFSHFASLDDLLSQIANEEIDDIISAAKDEGDADIDAIFTQLTVDTFNYPYLMGELLVKSIMSKSESSVSTVLSLMSREIQNGGFDNLLKEFSSQDVSALIFGAYFGLVFQKFADNASFDDPNEINNKIRQFIKILKNTEEN